MSVAIRVLTSGLIAGKSAGEVVEPNAPRVKRLMEIYPQEFEDDSLSLDPLPERAGETETADGDGAE